MNHLDDQEREPKSEGFLNYIPTILWQRRWLVILPTVLLFAAGIAASQLLPTIYRSSATLLVQSQDLPSALVDSPTGSVIDQRIAKIRQQVLSRGDLTAVIEQNDLYGEERRAEPLSAIVDRVRNATSVEPVGANVGQSAGGQTSTVAFQMRFDYRDPAKAQAVMQTFVQRFLEIDSSNTSDRANATVGFLQEQTGTLRRQITALEGQISAIKARNGASLSAVGMPTFSDPGSFDAQIVQLQNQNRLLAIQARRPRRNPQIVAAEAQLEAARAIYAENHPDVVLARQRLAQLRAAGDGTATTDQRDDDAAFRSQIDANNAAIATLGRSRSGEAARSSTSLAAQARGPAILEQVQQLDNRANVLRSQYQDAAANLLKAQGSARMAQEQRGDRLSVVEAPALPDEPVSPNRPLLIAGGLAAGLALGVGLALLIELVLRPIRGVAALENLGVETMGVVPRLTPSRRKASA